MRVPAKGDFAEKTIRRPANDSRKCRKHYVTSTLALWDSRLGKTYFFIAVCGAPGGVASTGLAAFCKRLVSGTPAGLRITILDRPSRPPGRKSILCAGS